MTANRSASRPRARRRSKMLVGISAGMSAGALVLLSTAAWAQAAPPTTIYVSPTGSNQTGTGTVGHPYATIQYAVSQAASGDTVAVMPGTYSGTVSITTDITLESTGGAAKTVLNASGSVMGIEVSGMAAAGTVVSGLTVTGASSHGILVLDTEHVTVEDNTITGTGIGLNPAIPEDKGIQLTGTSYSAVLNNTVSGAIDGGISVTDDGPLNPALAQPASGVALPGNGNLVEGNTVTGATHACGIIVAAYNSGPNAGVSGNVIMDNTVSGDVAGIVVAADTPNSHAEDNAVAGNVLEYNDLPGIIVHSNAPGDVVTGTVVVNNTLTGNGPDPEVGAMDPTGIALAGAVLPVTNTVVTNNTVANEHYGMFVDQAFGTTLTNNQITATVPVAPPMELSRPPLGVTAGQTLNFRAEAPGFANAEYQFWVDSASGWKMAQNYSPSPYFSLPVTDGSYEVVAYAMSPDQIAAGQWADAMSASQFVNVGSRVTLSVTSGMTMSSMGKHSAAMASSTMSMASGPGMPLTATASATNLLDPVYQFWVELPGGQWIQSGGYSTKNTFQLPMNSGTASASYDVIVYAKDAAAPAAVASEVWSAPVMVSQNPEVAFSVSPTSASVSPGGSETFTLSQVLMNGSAPASMYLDNLDATVAVMTSSGHPATGFSVSGDGVAGTHAVTSTGYTFMGAPTAQQGSFTLLVGPSVTPGTYQVIVSDPDHMLQTAAPVTVTVP